MDVTRIAVSVPTGAPSGATNAYLLGKEGALLVDPALRSDELDSAIAEQSVDHIAVTHHHPDHAGAVREYADETGATVWARRGRERSFTAATNTSPDRTFLGGTTIETGDGRVRVFDIPGHAPEHVGFEIEDGDENGNRKETGTERELLVGDLAVASGSVAVGTPDGDMRAYLGSLRRVHAHDPDVLYPGHGRAIDDPKTTIRDLIDRRLDREQRVREAVESGAATVPEITDDAYEKDVSAVRALAEATVESHLEKLAVEGTVAWDGTRASFVG